MTVRIAHQRFGQRRFRPVAIGILVVSALAGGGGAQAASLNPAQRGDHGRIAYIENTFSGGFDIFSIRPDGTRRRRLTFNNDSYNPAYGPQGRRIAYSKCGAASCSVWLMKADGENKRRLIPSFSSQPSWSPDGKEIVHIRDGQDGPQLFIYTLATGTTRPLTAGGTGPGPRAFEPTWSPGGKRVAFIQEEWREDSNGNVVPADNGALFTIRADGTGLTQVAPPGRLRKRGPDWSPHGGRIAFARILPGDDRIPSEARGISTIRPDGSDVRRLSRRFEVSPAWSPSGNQIAFTRVASEAPGNERPGLWSMSKLGNRARQVYQEFGAGGDPDWQPRM